jgi:hypothetical protein
VSGEISAREGDALHACLRVFCLSHGAGLVYVSTKNEGSIQRLRDYAAHVLVGTPLKHKPEVRAAFGLYKISTCLFVVECNVRMQIRASARVSQGRVLLRATLM